MNVKDCYSDINMYDEYRQSVTQALQEAPYDVIYSCVCSGRHSWVQKFIEKFQIHLLYVWNPKFRLQLDLTLTDYSFDYTLSAIFVYESLEKGFSQIKRGSGKIYSSTLEISRQLLKVRTSSCLWKLTFICSHVRIFLPC